jgi:hypothetical protein
MDKITNYLGQPIFSQVLSFIDNAMVEQITKLHKANRHSKKLMFKDHLVTMLYAVFTGCTSIREVQAGLELCQGKLNHFNLKEVPPRSTLSDGNKKRPSSIFGAVYKQLYKKYNHIISDSSLKKEIASKLYILDSSTFSLFKAILKPAGRKRNDGKSKGGMKVHTLLKADCNMPSFIKFTAAALHDQQFYQYIKELPDGSIITFDKAYINYEQFDLFNQRDIFFVIPQKENATYKSIKEFELKEEEPAILKDELTEVVYKIEAGGIVIPKTLQLRRIAYYSQKHQSTFVYITNHFDIEAMQVVEIYKNRWQIEKFFKKLKQNFPLAYFLGDNVNAIEIQIWCALIALLLLQVLHKENTSNLAFSILAAIVRLHLMNYTSITEVISHYKKKRQRKKVISPPSKTKKMAPPPFQIQFAF